MLPFCVLSLYPVNCAFLPHSGTASAMTPPAVFLGAWLLGDGSSEFRSPPHHSQQRPCIPVFPPLPHVLHQVARTLVSHFLALFSRTRGLVCTKCTEHPCCILQPGSASWALPGTTNQWLADSEDKETNPEILC